MTGQTPIRLAMLANGFTPVPVRTGQKHPAWDEWETKAAQADSAAVKTWGFSLPRCGSTGVLCGAVIGLDLDILDAALCFDIEMLAYLHFGESPLRRVGRAPKTLLVYRAADPAMRKLSTPRLRLGDGFVQVESLAAGQQFVAFGVHPDTGRPYQWNAATPENTTLDTIPAVTEPALRAFLEAAEQMLREAGATGARRGVMASSTVVGNRNQASLAPPSAAAVVRLFNRMPNTDDVDYDRYTRIMFAAVGCIQGLDCSDDDAEAIRDAACDWANRWESGQKYDPYEKWESDWSRRKAPLAGWRTLQDEARKLVDGYSLEIAQGEFADDLPPVNSDPALHAPTHRPAGRMRDRFIHPADCETGPRRGYVIKHLVAPGDVGALIGAPGTGKSILAPHLAYAVAQGRRVFGMRVKQGRVLYAAAEDASGMRQRVHALKIRHGDAPDFAMVECGNLRDPATAADLCAAAADWKPALVVIDTLGAAFAGMDENSSQDMGEAVALARRLSGQGCAVLLVHHTAKQSDGTPRGHSVLNGTLDVCITLAAKDESGVIRSSLGKNRNGSTDRDLAFRFDAVELGDDEDGDAITAPRAVEVIGNQPMAPRLSPAARKLIEVVNKMRNSDDSAPGKGDGSVDEAALRTLCSDQMALSEASNAADRERVFRRAFREAADNGRMSARDGRIWLKSVTFSLSHDDADKPDNGRTRPRPVLAGGGQSGQLPLGLSACPPGRQNVLFDKSTTGGTAPRSHWATCNPQGKGGAVQGGKSGLPTNPQTGQTVWLLVRHRRTRLAPLPPGAYR